ncbi:MAG: PAS domain S-box protein, partial [Methanospirillaceae archaeon]|nr:PAS domain S-box protein [Methanospirillaceae archaeon]
MKPEPIRIIYVDDDPALLDIGKIFLENTGEFVVTTAENAGDAIAILAEQTFEAIISDYQMPGMDGIAFLTHLRSSGDTTPFIIFTGKGREEVVIQALNEGADFYLQKGGDPKSQFAELSNKIRYAVSRRQGEKRLKESEERYKNVVETQSEFICRFLPDGTHLFVNEAYCRRFNTNPEELIGTRYKPVIHKDDRKMVSRLFASLTPDNPVGIIEQRIVLPDNEVVWDRWITRAFFDDDGTVREYQSVGRDITELRKREQMIKESEERFVRVMNLVPDMISIHDSEMTILYSNWMGFGAVPEEKRQVQTKCYRTYRNVEDVCPDCQAHEVFSSKKPFEKEVFLPDGRWFDLRVIPVLDADGNVEYFMEWARDITERKRTEL